MNETVGIAIGIHQINTSANAVKSGNKLNANRQVTTNANDAITEQP